MTSKDEGPGNPGGVLERLRTWGLSPRKALGQHFLHDPRLLRALVRDAGVGPDEHVFEVGTGPGTLTRELALATRQVLSVDIDPELLEFARSELSGCSNVELLLLDALETGPITRISSTLADRLRRLPSFTWVSNLPYGIASPLIVAFLEAELPWTRAALLVQEEVAERLAARPGSASVGPLGMLVAYWADVELGRRVSPGAFWPPPEVWSRVAHLRSRLPLGPGPAFGPYSRWVKRLFQGRRKQLGGQLRRILGPRRAPSALGVLGVGSSARPEDVSPPAFARLAQEFPDF